LQHDHHKTYFGINTIKKVAENPPSVSDWLI